MMNFHSSHSCPKWVLDLGGPNHIVVLDLRRRGSRIGGIGDRIREVGLSGRRMAWTGLCVTSVHQPSAEVLKRHSPRGKNWSVGLLADRVRCTVLLIWVELYKCEEVSKDGVLKIPIRSTSQ